MRTYTQLTQGQQEEKPGGENGWHGLSGVHFQRNQNSVVR